MRKNLQGTKGESIIISAGSEGGLFWWKDYADSPAAKKSLGEIADLSYNYLTGEVISSSTDKFVSLSCCLPPFPFPFSFPFPLFFLFPSSLLSFRLSFPLLLRLFAGILASPFTLLPSFSFSLPFALPFPSPFVPFCKGSTIAVPLPPPFLIFFRLLCKACLFLILLPVLPLFLFPYYYSVPFSPSPCSFCFPLLSFS